MSNIADRLDKDDFDPVQNTFKHLSEQYLLNLRGRPGENFTKGYLNAKAAEADYKEKYIERQKNASKIYESLNQSRQNQETLLENMRHNRASMAYNHKALAQADRHHGATLGETIRHNKDSMAYNREVLGETNRHNIDSMAYKREVLGETNRHNIDSMAYNREALGETNRHNIDSMAYKREVLGETNRHNIDSMAYNREALGETNRHNLASENLSSEALRVKANKNASGPVIVGNEVINPKIKLEMTDEDHREATRLKERKIELEGKSKPILDMINFIITKKAEGDLPRTGDLAFHTPNLTQTAKEFDRLGTAMVQAIGLEKSGNLTNQKIFFMGKSKPNPSETVEAMYNYAIGKLEPIQKAIKEIDYQNTMYGNGIPYRYSTNALNYATETKEDPNTYLKDVLEGKAPSKEFKEYSKPEPFSPYESLPDKWTLQKLREQEQNATPSDVAQPQQKEITPPAAVNLSSKEKRLAEIEKELAEIDRLLAMDGKK
jgi:hypothetical protein